MGKSRHIWGLLCALAVCGGTSAAQDPIDLEPTVDTDTEWVYYGDLLVRAERTADIPNRADDLERLRGRARVGARRDFESFEVGAAIEASLGSDSNRNNRANLDNERSDAANVDEFYLRWRAGEATSVLLGKTAFPIVLTPLTWDDDLRPIGVSASHSIAVGDFSRVQLTGGYFAGDHLYGDRSRIAAAQAGWFWNEGTSFSGDAQLAWLDFSDLQSLVDHGLGRTNRRVGSRLVNDYRLLDFQVGLQGVIGRSILRTRLDLVRNMGADDDAADGARFSSILGDSRDGGWELGFAIQRFQRDAVVAAFTSDDWWFHSFARGVMPWVGYGFNQTWRMQLSAFRETRDGLTESTDRLLLDVRGAW